MRAIVLSTIAAMLQFNSVTMDTKYARASDEAWNRLREIPPSGWNRDFTIEVSELDGLPVPSLPDTPNGCLAKDATCSEVEPRCPTRTYCEFTRLDPYLGHARRVTVRAATSLAMTRGKPIADAIVNEPLDANTLKRVYFDDVRSNNLLADTSTPAWIESASA